MILSVDAFYLIIVFSECIWLLCK